MCYAKMYRLFRHGGYAWIIGILWIELLFLVNAVKTADLLLFMTMDWDWIGSFIGRSLSQTNCQKVHGRLIQEIASEYDFPYTTVKRWFYLYAADQLAEENPKHICILTNH